MSTLKHVYLVRHGETESNVAQTVQGSDDPLTAHGLLQAERVAERVSKLDIDVIVTSDYLRARQTADTIVRRTGLPYETSELFREIRQPTEFVGVSSGVEPYQHFLRDWEANVLNTSWRHADGENYADVHERAKQAKTFLESRSEQNILIVTHGAFLIFLTAVLLFEDSLTPPIERVLWQKLRRANTGLTLFSLEHELWRLVTWNDHSHLG